MSYKAHGTDFLRKGKVTNFGRTERITGAQWTTMIDVDIDAQQCWTVTVDTKQITAALAPGFSSISSKVMARVEVGSGNAVSEQVFDASDLAQLTIAGDHVRVALTLAGTLTLAPAANGSDYEGSADPGPAPIADAALVSCFLSSEFITVTPPGVDYAVPCIFGPPGSLTSLGGAALVTPSPTRVRRVSGYNPSASMLYLNLRSSGHLAELNSPITRLYSTPLPPGQLVQAEFATGQPYARGLVWDVTTSADGSHQSATSVRVDVELGRKPSVLLVTSINPTS